MKKSLCLLFGLLAGTASVASADEFATTVDMRDNGAATFYVKGEIAGLGPIDLMVDTGSGYTTINEEILARLQGTTHVRYVRKMRGRLANGQEMSVAVYTIGSVNIGGNCWLNNVEAAVFPGKTRPILGLNALQRTAPFIFSFEPPRLHLSNCAASTAQAAKTADVAAFE